MTDKLNGKVAAFTVAALGIGLECAKAMLQAGATVFLVDRAADTYLLLISSPEEQIQPA